MRHSNFFQKIRTVIDNIAICKTKRVKTNTQNFGKKNSRNKLFKRFKKSRLHIDKELYKNK